MKLYIKSSGKNLTLFLFKPLIIYHSNTQIFKYFTTREWYHWTGSKCCTHQFPESRFPTNIDHVYAHPEKWNSKLVYQYPYKHKDGRGHHKLYITLKCSIFFINLSRIQFGTKNNSSKIQISTSVNQTAWQDCKKEENPNLYLILEIPGEQNKMKSHVIQQVNNDITLEEQIFCSTYLIRVIYITMITHIHARLIGDPIKIQRSLKNHSLLQPDWRLCFSMITFTNLVNKLNCSHIH